MFFQTSFPRLPKENADGEPCVRRMPCDDAHDLITKPGVFSFGRKRVPGGVRTTYEGDAKLRILGNFGSYTTER